MQLACHHAAVSCPRSLAAVVQSAAAVGAAVDMNTDAAAVLADVAAALVLDHEAPVAAVARASDMRVGQSLDVLVSSGLEQSSLLVVGVGVVE